MTESEWLSSDDPIAMQRALRVAWRGKEAEFVRSIHCFLLDCCRAIWPLLPMEETRRGVEVAERYLLGRATREELCRAEYDAEGAAFFLEPDHDRAREERIEAAYKADLPEAWAAYRHYQADREVRIEQLVRELEAIPLDELRRLVRLGRGDQIEPRCLLSEAAYFADSAIVYPLCSTRGEVMARYPQFLSARLLRRVVGHIHRPKRSAIN